MAASISDRGHPMPRRASPETSVTLHHHKIARDASIARARREASQKPMQGQTQIVDGGKASPSESAQRESSGESQITGKSDPRRWFDRSNKNPAAEYGGNAMDVDPPFFQKESDSSNEEGRQPMPPAFFAHGDSHPPSVPLARTQSSSEDFRSIVDDLTVENQRLKEELRRYKQFGPGLMRKDKLFEIKVHGLPARKKRELEATLRDFAATLEGSSENTSPKRKSKHSTKSHHFSTSKHASSSSSNSRPVDSAYASMSAGNGSSATSLQTRPTLNSLGSSDQKVKNYLDDIPAGLYPGLNPMALNESDKARLIVKKLEQLFTGRITGRTLGREPSSMDVSPSINLALLPEPAREAVIEQQLSSGKKTRSRDNMSSNSNHESGGNDTGNGSGENSGSTTVFKLPPNATSLPEQRPTRPRDLDPNRPQIPSENMDYIRHLGLVAPELLAGSKSVPQDVSPDAEGWVYLNLLANLAQLHILNVSPEFIRRAVREKSTKFQVSTDGRKIRWRGGTEGTHFTSDSSGEAYGASPLTEEDGGNEDVSQGCGQRKRRKTDDAGLSNKKRSAMVAPAPPSSANFHYKPMFLHKESSGDTSLEDSESQDSRMVTDSSGVGDSRRASGSGASPRRKRRADGAMVFYTGASFCIDLSCDQGDVSPTTYLTSSAQDTQVDVDQSRPSQWCSRSGSSLVYRPLTDRVGDSKNSVARADSGARSVTSSTASGSIEDSDMEDVFLWSKEPQQTYARPIEPPLEPSGIGGVYPEDHFAIVVTTRRPRHPPRRGGLTRKETDESIDTTHTIMNRLAKMSASSPRAHYPEPKPASVKIQYVSGKVHHFAPIPLPPPLMYMPPLTESSDTTDYGESTGSQLDEMTDEQGAIGSSSEDISRKANPHVSDIPTDLDDDASSGASSDVPGPSIFKARSRPLRRDITDEDGAIKANVDSSVATAGGEGSGYSSSMKE